MSGNSWNIQVFYDGQCPLCTREIDLLRRLDRRKRIRFTDITAEGFDPAAYGQTQSQFMDRIQGRLHGGQWIEGVEVFRQLYAAVGFRWLVALSRLPGITQVLDWAYDKFASNRLRLTGRCDPNGSCRLPATERS